MSLLLLSCYTHCSLFRAFITCSHKEKGAYACNENSLSSLQLHMLPTSTILLFTTFTCVWYSDKDARPFPSLVICYIYSICIYLSSIPDMWLEQVSGHSYVHRSTMSKNEYAPKGSRIQSPTLKKNPARKKTIHSRKTSMSASPKADLPKHTIEEADAQNNFTAHVPPSTPSSPAPQRRKSDGRSRRHSSASLAELLREKGCDSIPDTYNLHLLWSASTDPPITKEVLSELDLYKLFNGIYLRHDLNFDRDIQFSPRNPHSPFCKQKQLEAQRYWDALEIELAMYGSYLEGLLLLQPNSLLDAHCPLPPPRSLKDVPLRLPEMIRAMRRIVETLVPPTKWPAVRARLNASLFIQQLEHGQCDIEALFNWVGNLLLESCAPSRDSRIEAMVKTISQGSRQQDSHILRRGLQDLFCILEIMKLVSLSTCYDRQSLQLTVLQDAANYQLQLLRDFMLNTHIEFERSQIQWRMRNGCDVKNWLDRSIAPDSIFSNHFALFTSKLIEMIVLYNMDLPTALHLDHTRIHKLQTTFQILIFQKACFHTLDSTLAFLDWTGKVPEPAYIETASLISAIEQDLSLDVNQQREALILGIASHAYKLCGKLNVPTPQVLSHTASVLGMAADAQSPVSEDIISSLSESLTKLVEAELDVVKDFDPVQLANRYTSPAKMVTVLPIPATNATMSDTKFQQAALGDMARTIAHIAMLHWRVWAPVLYLRPSDSIGKEEVEESGRMLV